MSASTLLESLKRLYAAGKIDAEKINSLQSITEAEKAEILSAQTENREQEYLGYLADLGGGYQ